MRKILNITLTIFLLSVFALSSTAQKRQKKDADIDTRTWRYEILAEQVGSQGSYLIKVWSYSKNSKIAVEQAKKNAVHGIIFKGYAGREGIPGQKPLAAPNIEEKYQAYFDAFFADFGKYMKFVEIAGDGQIAANDIMKIGKEYKIGIVISVSAFALRKQLEEDSIIAPLGAGF